MTTRSHERTVWPPSQWTRSSSMVDIADDLDMYECTGMPRRTR
jgi:hypothetical protein